MRVAGAYWRGDEQQPDAPAHLRHGVGQQGRTSTSTCTRLEEAAKRDHRKLANELDLLSFPDELGGGLAVWHPKGAIVRKLMEDYCRQRHHDGRLRVRLHARTSPSPTLCETSGPPRLLRRRHVPADGDGRTATYYPKPMNCPLPHPDLPEPAAVATASCRCACSSWARCTATSGPASLHGLMRIRGFTQDDSHIFCTPRAGASTRSGRCSASCSSVLRGVRLRRLRGQAVDARPRASPSARDEDWDDATEALRAALEAEGLPYEVDEGGGAFYGPKIDVDVRDAIGRALAAVDDPVRLQHARALRPGVRRRRRPAAPAGR